MKQVLLMTGMAGMVVCCAAGPILLASLGSFTLGGVLGYFDASLLPWGIGLMLAGVAGFSIYARKRTGRRGYFCELPPQSLKNSTQEG
ncbi:MAG: hypothetical protein H8E38_08640 [SAR324 cluster bacterium]|nr:hypothetical protein [SAR324 cluster bacterium]